jgi:hypothetical protein
MIESNFATPRRGTGVARRARRAAAVFGVLTLGALGVGAVFPAPAVAAEPAPTMTFKGISLLGLLDSIAVAPATVNVPSGGKLTFVNASGVPMKLKIGSDTYDLAKSGAGASRTFTFQGATSAQQMKAVGTALNIPLVGTLTSPTGTVNVAAAPKPPPPATTDPKPGEPDPGNGVPPTGTPGNPGTNPTTPGGAPVPQVLVPGVPQKPPSLGRSPVARGGMASADLPTATEDAGAASEGPTGSTPDESAAAAENAAGRGTEVTSVGGGIGLLILVATILLGGVGSAAIRTVLAQRSVVTRS